MSSDARGIEGFKTKVHGNTIPHHQQQTFSYVYQFVLCVWECDAIIRGAGMVENAINDHVIQSVCALGLTRLAAITDVWQPCPSEFCGDIKSSAGVSIQEL